MIIIVLILLWLLAIFFANKLMKAIVNLWLVVKYRKDIPQHKGIVLNKKTKKLEDSNSPILPY